ncbi:transposase family protein [Streptomyces sp. NPDC005969]|uniref:transposase family protein n=1 Tax=Streptomyces sp. NPDC005969 TaxID=3156722 RepID=UPI0033D57D56
MLVACLMRKNLTQEVAGAVFGVSHSTASRRWDPLRPIIRRAVASFIPHQVQHC